MTVLALWATPRTVSTAFERMVIERGDHLVLDEPWSRAYYLGPDRRSHRFPLVFPESTYEAVTRSVLALGARERVFVKDMAYQAGPGLDDDALSRITHSFLIRDPRAALRSLLHRWPDATEDEAGHVAQAELFRRVVEVTGSIPAVIDSDVLRADPAGVVGAWCRRVDLDVRQHSLEWEPGMRAEWQLWRNWYENAARSTGFMPPATTADQETEEHPRAAALLRAARPAYEHLRQHAIDAGRP